MKRIHSKEEWKVIVNEFYELNKTLDIPSNTTYKGYNIGRWIYTQQEAYRNNKLSKEELEWLNSMNMIWKNRQKKKNDDSWNTYYKELKVYYNKYGQANIPLRYVQNGLLLGKWFQRQKEKARKGTLELSKVKKLEKLNVSFELQSNKIKNSTSLPEQIIYFYTKKMFGNNNETINRYQGFEYELDVYNEKYNFGIEYDGQVFHNKKVAAKDNKKDICFLENNVDLYRVREIGCSTLKMEKKKNKVNYHTYYYDSNGTTYLDKFSKCLEKLFLDLSKKYNKEMIEIDIHRDMLKVMENVNATIPHVWLRKFNLYKECYKKLGTPNVPHDYKYKGENIGGWCSTQRQVYTGKKKGILLKEQIELLENENFCWNIMEQQWNEQYEKIREFVVSNNRFPKYQKGNVLEISLYSWFESQKKKVAKKQLLEEQIERLYELNTFVKVA